jgi:chromosome segregation ATPase
MVVPPAEPGATADLGTPEAGSTRKLLLDEMLAERERAPLPPAPVLTLQPVPVDAAPVGAGRKGAMKRLAEVEALARNNLRAAEEARRVMEAERALLEEEASARTQAERTASGLRREIERLRSTEEQRAAQARFAAAHQARTELATEMERVHDEHSRVVDELDRMRGTLFDHDSLLDEYSQRLHEEQEAQAKARAELVRAEESQRTAERNLEIALETARRRAEDDHARLVRVEEQLRDTVDERDRATAELRAITEGDGELVRLRAEAAAAREDMTQLLTDLDVQAARADKAETELATALETTAQAQRAATEATEARDLAGIDLETTRSELADRNEILDSERSESQARIADLSAQLRTITRSAESANDRVTDLEAQLAAAVTLRDNASAQAADAAEQLEHAGADVDELRRHAVTIGDELAATHAAFEKSQRELEQTRRRLKESRRDLERARQDAVEASNRVITVDADTKAAAVDAAVETDVDVDVDIEVDVEVEAEATSDPIKLSNADPIAVLPEPPAARSSGADAEMPPLSKAKRRPDIRGYTPPVTIFRTVDSGIEPRRSGGPEVEREAALLRHLGPVDPEPAEVEPEVTSGDATTDAITDPITGDAPDGEAQPVPAWRRTAMAELTALAADSDDLTPRRRR